MATQKGNILKKKMNIYMTDIFHISANKNAHIFHFSGFERIESSYIILIGNVDKVLNNCNKKRLNDIFFERIIGIICKNETKKKTNSFGINY